MNLCCKNKLHYAAQSGDNEYLEKLLVNGFNLVDSLKRGDWTPLMMAASKGHTTTVHLLISRGANLRMVNKDGWTALHIACRNGSLDVVKILVSNCPDLCSMLSRNGRSCLHIAALHGYEEIVAYLVNPKFWRLGVNCEDSCGTTPLMDALRAGHVDAAATLLNAGADLFCHDNLGRSALHVAAQSGSVASLGFLTSKSDQLGIDEPAKFNESQTPLMLAAREGHLEALKFLLSMGANRYKCDDHSRTALDHAIIARRFNVIDVLKQNENEDIKQLEGTVS